MPNIFYILLALFFLLLNAFFVLSEFAIVKIRFTRLEELDAKGVKSAKTAKEIVKDLEAYLSTAQLGITIASLGLGWVGEPAVANLITPIFNLLGMNLAPAVAHTVSIALAFALTTGMHVVLGELVPKNISIRIPEESVLFVAIPFKIFHNVFFVPMWILNESANLVLKLLKVTPSHEDKIHSDEELRMILGQTQEYGRISLGRLMMFEHLFDFGKTKVKEIMTTKPNIAYINSNDSWKETQEMIKTRKFSRYPLTAADEGPHFYLHLKELISSFNADTFDPHHMPDLNAIKRPLFEISEEITAEKALRIFQEKRLQLALVRGPQKEITGLLSIEDVVEELTGEIRDEFDRPPSLTLSSIFHPEASIMDLRASDKISAIKELTESLHRDFPNFDKSEAINAVIKRENNFSTALGHRTAFPHARLASLSTPILAIGKSKEGIPFPSADNQPVNIIFLILTPFNKPTSQLNILKELSGLISNKTLLQRLYTAKSSDAFMDILCTFENKVMD